MVGSVDDDPRKRVERGGEGTKEGLLSPQAKAPVYAPEDLSWIQGAKAGGINQFELGEPGVVVAPAGVRISDHTFHTKSPLGGGLKSPPEPRQKDPKRMRGEVEEKAPDDLEAAPKRAKPTTVWPSAASSQREASRAADPLLRQKSPPPAVPAKADAQAKAKAIPEVKESPRSARLPQQGTITGTLASTNDPHQNAESPTEQDRRRKKTTGRSG